ncbi:MAG: ABC transporter ATP-binding protein, partial [Firmicutes bacterium]|nr:ABC transporter ATP-binding protein [Bacillota bacterium]
MIVCDNLVKIYRVMDLEIMALQGLELKIFPQEVMAIIGASGSGKSTLLNILGGLDEPTAGSVVVADWDLGRLSSKQRLIYMREVVGFVWQNVARNLVPYLTAQENVLVPMLLAGKVDQTWARELLEAVGLGHRLNHKPLEMSGGEQQRVAIAIALANRPKVLLADEPTGALDTKTSRQILEVFHHVSETYKVTVVIVTH